MYPHEHYHHGHPEMHNHGEGRPYIEPDWFANHHDGALPLVSTIGRGPKGYGLSIEKDEHGNLIVSSDDPMEEPETFHVGDWNIYVTQENNGETPVGQNTKFTVHVEDGVRHVAKDIVVPCGAKGTQFFLGGTNEPLHRRDDNTYVIDNVWPWSQNLNREYGIPDPRVGDCVMFDVDGNLAIGMIVQVTDGHVMAYTDNLYFDWPIINRPAPQLNINKVTYMSPECFGVKFFVGIPQAVLDGDSHVKFDAPRATPSTEIRAVADAERYPTYGYMFQTGVAPKNCNDDIAFTGWDDADTKLNILGPDGGPCKDKEYHFTVCSILDSVISNSTDSEVKAFAQAMKDYGIAVQIYLGWYSEGLKVSKAVKDLDPSVLDQYAPSKSGTVPTGIGGISQDKYNINMAWTSNIKLRQYFTLEAGHSLSDYTFKINGNAAVPHYRESTRDYYLETSEIPVLDLDEDYVFSISDGVDTITHTISCLGFADLVAGRNNDQANAAKSLYLYYKAATELFE